MKKSPIYLFYEIVANGTDGTPGDDGNVQYRCFQGVHKVCTLKKSMRSNLNGTVFLPLWFAIPCSTETLISSREQPMRPCQAHVSTLLLPQRLRSTPNTR